MQLTRNEWLQCARSNLNRHENVLKKEWPELARAVAFAEGMTDEDWERGKKNDPTWFDPIVWDQRGFEPCLEKNEKNGS